MINGHFFLRLFLQNLDFDFEKCCVVSLSPINVYACLVCGKYFQVILLSWTPCKIHLLLCESAPRPCKHEQSVRHACNNILEQAATHQHTLDGWLGKVQEI